jgi:hypothetical protein
VPLDWSLTDDYRADSTGLRFQGNLIHNGSVNRAGEMTDTTVTVICELLSCRISFVDVWLMNMGTEAIPA